MPARLLLIIAALILMLAAAGIAVVTQPFVVAVRSQSPQVASDRLQAHVKHLSVDLYPRSYDQARKLELAADYILAEFKATGATVTVQEVTVETGKYKNIIARFGPPTGALLVIGAHYDSHGSPTTSAPGYTRDSHTPGADDNASGVAGLLELSRLLGQGPQTRPIELVAYTLEEPPYFRTENMGSAWHARSLGKVNRDVRLMLSLEMIGFFSDERGSQSYPAPAMSHLYSDRGDFVAIVGKLSDFGATRRAKALMAGATDLPVYSINAPASLHGIDFSDHLSYWNAGYPALMVTDTAFLRNPNYHQATDTYDKLDYRRMAKVVQGVFAITQMY